MCVCVCVGGGDLPVTIITDHFFVCLHKPTICSVYVIGV